MFWILWKLFVKTLAATNFSTFVWKETIENFFFQTNAALMGGETNFRLVETIFFQCGLKIKTLMD